MARPGHAKTELSAPRSGSIDSRGGVVILNRAWWTCPQLGNENGLKTAMLQRMIFLGLLAISLMAA